MGGRDLGEAKLAKKTPLGVREDPSTVWVLGKAQCPVVLKLISGEKR